MEDTAIPYELPEVKDHSFFFIDQCVKTNVEAKLHRHDAWELYYVVHGCGRRMAGDTLQPFAAGDVALIPPSMLHRWEYAPDSADKRGYVRYLMVAFSHSLVERCVDVFLNCATVWLESSFRPMHGSSVPKAPASFAKHCHG